MRWPWTRKEPEKRQSQPLTDAIVSAIAAQAGGNLTGDATAVGALEMASGAYSRAFSGCTVQASDMVKRALTPSILGGIARSLIRRGESMHLIEITGGDILLLPVGSWDIRGGPNQRDWYVRADVFGPSGNLTHFVPYSQVVICKICIRSCNPVARAQSVGLCQLDGRFGRWHPDASRARGGRSVRLHFAYAYLTPGGTIPRTMRVQPGR